MKEELVKKLLSKGKLVTPDALESLSEDKLSEILAGRSFIVERTDVTQKRETFRVLKNITRIKKELSVDDFAEFYRSKYEKIKDILVSRVPKPYVSLNKAGTFRDEIYVIGMVRAIKEKDGKFIVDLEDTTGCVPVIFDSRPDTEQDDVIAVRALSSKNVLFGKQIIYPDIPLRAPVTGSGSICIASSFMLDETPQADIEKFFSWFESTDVKYLIVPGDVVNTKTFEDMVERYCSQKVVIFVPGEREEASYPRIPVNFASGKIISLSDPAAIEINGVNVLITHDFGLSMLKKRHLSSPKRMLDDDMLVLDSTPDIVCFGHSDDAQVFNYKSVTMAASGSMLTDFRPVIIDLETRETQQIRIK